MTIVLSSFRARQDVLERDLAIEALKVSRGYMAAAARLCGLSPARFREIVLRHNLRSQLNPNPRPGRPIGGNSAWRALADV